MKNQQLLNPKLLNDHMLKKRLKMLYEFFDILQENSIRLSELVKQQKQNKQTDLLCHSKHKLSTIKREIKKVQAELDELKNIEKDRRKAMVKFMFHGIANIEANKPKKCCASKYS